MYWTYKNVSENVFKETFIKKLNQNDPFNILEIQKKAYLACIWPKKYKKIA